MHIEGQKQKDIERGLKCAIVFWLLLWAVQLEENPQKIYDDDNDIIITGLMIGGLLHKFTNTEQTVLSIFNLNNKTSSRCFPLKNKQLHMQHVISRSSKTS